MFEAILIREGVIKKSEPVNLGLFDLWDETKMSALELGLGLHENEPINQGFFNLSDEIKIELPGTGFVEKNENKLKLRLKKKRKKMCFLGTSEIEPCLFKDVKRLNQEWS